jgi:hypothetical protein
MSICTVNGTAHEIGSDVKTWGHLLDTLEQGEGFDRTVVTGVRFSGVEHPTFREAESLTAALSTLGSIDVDLSTRGELVEFARRTAAGSLDALVDSARHTADAFRLHDLPTAHSGLADFVTTFQLLTALTAEVSQLTPGSADAGTDIVERLNTSLGALVDFDVNEDWISVADVLEYEIADLLPEWGAVIGAGDASEIPAATGALS